VIAARTNLQGFVLQVMREQRALNNATLAITTSRGAVEGDEYPLEATFWTETEEHAQTIAAHLRREHGYAVDLRPVPAYDDEAPELRKIVARTRPTPLLRGVLDEWTDDMVWAGWKHGSAEFDGWSAVLEP
jgi:hypothetical protein